MSNNSEGPRSFSVFLGRLAQGEAHSELSVHLHELAKKLEYEAAVQNKKVSGELTFKLKLTAEPNGVVAAAYECNRKEPAPNRPGSIFWVSQGGNLTEQNPRQQNLPLHEVPGGEPEMRDIGAGEAGPKEV